MLLIIVNLSSTSNLVVLPFFLSKKRIEKTSITILKQLLSFLFRNTFRLEWFIGGATTT